jgi:hypothetical protein
MNFYGHTNETTGELEELGETYCFLHVPNDDRFWVRVVPADSPPLHCNHDGCDNTLPVEMGA